MAAFVYERIDFVSTKEYTCPSWVRRGKLMRVVVTERWEARKAVDVYINGRHSRAYKAYTLTA